MKLFRFNSLAIKCKEESVKIDLSKDITYIFGEISAGKTTIAKLIDFCFGSDLKETPALEEIFIATELHLTIGDRDIKISRSRKSNILIVEWKEPNNQIFALEVPLKQREKPILGNNVYNFNDLIFYFMDIDPIKVRRSKSDEESPLVRLSIRDILWYCYLDQDTIDSNFFNLSTPYLQAKSRDVISFLIGYYTQRLKELQYHLHDIREEKRIKEVTAKNIDEFLQKHEIGSRDSIMEKIKNLEREISIVENEKTKIKNGYQKETRSYDELRNQITLLRNVKLIQQRAIEDLKEKINEQEALKAEFESSKVKIARIDSAEFLLSNVSFERCPLCTNDLKDSPRHENKCYLCGSDLKEIKLNDQREFLKSDLKTRISELSESINFHQQNSVKLKTELIRLEERLNQFEIDFQEKVYVIESRYLEDLIFVEKEISSKRERVQSLKKILSLSDELISFYNNITILEEKERELKKLVEQEETNLPDPSDFKALLEENYLKILVKSNVPNISDEDFVDFNLKNFIPKIKLQSGDIEVDFNTVSSGGKKTLFKVCFALALHMTCSQLNRPLPNFLIIDTPMKNIGSLNRNIFKSFYETLYNLSLSDLGDTQFIIIDKEYIKPQFNQNVNIKEMHLDPEKNPLFKSYRE